MSEVNVANQVQFPTRQSAVSLKSHDRRPIGSTPFEPRQSGVHDADVRLTGLLFVMLDPVEERKSERDGEGKSPPPFRSRRLGDLSVGICF